MKRFFLYLFLLLPFASFAQPRARIGTIASSIHVTTGYDTDAQAVITYITGTGATLTTPQQDAINTRITAMKSRGTWTKRVAYYGFVGGTAAAHACNWKDPRDLNAAFRLTFSGTWTHSATGSLPDGSTAYADTHMNASTALVADNTHIAFYSRTNQGSCNCIDVSAYDSGPTNSFQLSAKRNGSVQSDMYDTGGGRQDIANSNSQGEYAASRTSSSNFIIYKNGSQIGTVSTSGGALPGYNIFIGSRDDTGTPSSYSAKEFGSVSIGSALTATELANDYTDEMAFQTSLSRNV